MISRLTPLNSKPQRTLNRLLADLREPGESKVIDTAPGTFLAVHLEQIQRTREGMPIYSIAHYIESNGDLIADPDLVVIRRSDGGYCPLSLQTILSFTVAIRWHEGAILADEKAYRSIRDFAQIFVANINNQQGIL